jgi:hypothetical protein
MFVDAFRYLVSKNNIVPSQDKFCSKYFELNSESLKPLIISLEIKTGLEARLRRTYPSLIRDLHFQALLEENGFEVSYNRDVDVKAGIDHIVKYKGFVFQIHCYVGTNRGRFSRDIKNSRHVFSGTHLELILDLSNPSTKKVGDFFLYSKNEIDLLLSQMDQRIT